MSAKRYYYGAFVPRILGVDEARRELENIKQFLKNSSTYSEAFERMNDLRLVIINTVAVHGDPRSRKLGEIMQEIERLEQDDND